MEKIKNKMILRVLFILGIALIIIIPVLFGMVRNKNSKLENLSSSLFEEVYQEILDFDELNLPSKQDEASIIIEKLNEIIEDFPSTVAGERASFYRGYVAYYSEDFSNAQAYFSEFLKKNKASHLTAKAHYFQSYIYENNDQIEEAFNEIDALINHSKDSYYKPFAYFRKAELYQKNGEKEKALENYKIVVEKYSNSSQAEEAKKRMIGLQ